MARIPTLSAASGGGILPGVPAMPRSIPGGNAVGGLAARIEALTAQKQNQADQIAADAATTAGDQAGDASPGAQMEGGGSLYRAAFNRAATDSSLRRLQITARDQLDQLAREHEADPEGFAQKAAAYRDGLAGGLPETMRTAWLRGFDTQAQPFVNQARDRLERRTADEALASFNELLPRRTAALERLAGQAARGDQAAARALEQEQTGLVLDLARLGPRSEFTLAGRHFPADPSRTGARSVAQLTEMLADSEARRTDAATLAAWRAAGSSEAWIDGWTRQRTGAAPAGGQALASPERLAARLPESWRGIVAQAAEDNRLPPAMFAALIGLESGGKAGAVSAAGAVGPAQIMAATARDPGYGVPPLPEAARTDPAQAIPWAAKYLAALRDHFGGDMAKALAAYNGGAKRVENGEPLPEETRNYVATLLPATAAGAAPADMPLAEVRRVERLLRSELAADERAIRERQQQARTELEPLMRENAAAIAEQGRPVHSITDAQLSAAGLKPDAIARYRAAERAGQYGFQAQEELRGADTPEKVQAIAERFAPGGEMFAADPALAARILDRARARGVAVRGASLAQDLADRTAEASATGEARPITRQEGAAAGLTPEETDKANRELAKAAELGRITREGLTQSPADRTATRARLAIEGDQASENAARLQAYERAWRVQDEQREKDPAGLVVTGSKPAQALVQRIAGGELDALPQLVDLLTAEQTRMGIPPAQQKQLPAALADALTQQVLRGATAGDRVTATRALLDRIPEGAARRQVLDAMGGAGLPEGVRIAAGAAPRIGMARAIRLADELDTQAKQLNVTPQLRKEADTTAGAIFDGEAGWFGGDDGLGTLRAAQYQATGQAAFLRAGQDARERLVRVALVRGAGAGGSPSTADVRGAYADLFGGVRIINRPGDGVLVAAPTGTDADALVRGLAALRDRELARVIPGDTPAAQQARQAAARGMWVDAGAGFAFYPANTGAPLAAADGRALIVTAEQATEASATAPGRHDATAPGQPHNWAQRQQHRFRERLADETRRMTEGAGHE